MSKIEGIPDGWEFVRFGTVQPGEWSLCSFGDPEFCTTDNLKNKNYVIVRKIEPSKPVYIPWTFETCPVGCVVKRKDLLSFQWMITAKTDTSAGQSGNYYLYDRLFHEFTQLNGTPCGTIANDKKLIKTAPGYVEKTPRTANWIGEKKRCGVCQITKAAKHFEGNRQVCNECRGK